MHPFGDPARGFGLDSGVVLDVACHRALGSVGSYGWGGVANTTFRVDPKEQLVGLLMLQFTPSGTCPVVPDCRVAVYQSIVD